MAHFGLSRPIVSDYLHGIANLSPQRPVFLLTATDGSHVVIKHEVSVFATDAQAMKIALKTIIQVSPAAAGKTLDNYEVEVVRGFVDMTEYIAQALAKPLDPDFVYLKTLLAQQGLWYKMDKAEGVVSIEKARQKADAGDKTAVRNIAAAFSAPDGLEALGRIIAADLWNGNNDRFTPGGTGGNGYRVCQNPGNVLLATQGTLKPIGLDAYEAMGAYRHYNQTIPNLEGVDTWPGRLLGDDKRTELREFCQDAIADIEQILGPRNRKGLGKLGTTRRLPSNAVTRLQHGVIAGSLPIKAKMRQLAGRANPPVGLISRLTILGWWP
jgi:hypothetical protein